MASSRPGVSYRSSSGWLPAVRLMRSTWRVVLCCGLTSPKRVLRVRVRSSEVLPTLVWPTMASCMDSDMPVLRQPGRTGAVCDAKRYQCLLPALQALRVGVAVQQPDLQLSAMARQFAHKIQAATVGRAAGIAGQNHPAAGRAGQPLQQGLLGRITVQIAQQLHAVWRTDRPV